jgi:hypothetical protein
MPSKQGTERLLAAAALLAAALAAACSASTNTNPTAPQPQAAPAVPEDVQAVARAAFGAEGEALAYGDFPDAGGRQVLVVNRLAGAALPVAAAGSASQSPETSVDVIRVSILVREDKTWKEAFHADEHLKNRRGYLDRMRVSASGWRMRFEKTPDSGFRLEFTPLGLPPGTKLETTRVAWNPRRKEYDSLDASGTRFLEPASAPGGAAMRVER